MDHEYYTERERQHVWESERGIVQKVNENALSLNLFLPLPSAFPAPFRSPILINKYANANYRCCCCCRFYPLATFRTMRFGIAIPGCIALCRPIFIIFANNWFGLNIRHRHFPYLKFQIWIFKLQAASLHIRSCPLPLSLPLSNYPLPLPRCGLPTLHMD